MRWRLRSSECWSRRRALVTARLHACVAGSTVDAVATSMLHVLDPDLDLGDRQSCQALDLVLHAVPQCRRHLGEVEAVLDDDAELDRHAVLGVAADR